MAMVTVLLTRVLPVDGSNVLSIGTSRAKIEPAAAPIRRSSAFVRVGSFIERDLDVDVVGEHVSRLTLELAADCLEC